MVLPVKWRNLRRCLIFMRVVSNATCVYMIYLEDNSAVTFMPGLNYIENEKVKEHPHFIGRVKSGIFSLVEDDVKSKKTKSKKSENLSDFESIESSVLLKDIEQMLDIALLEKIVEKDTRPAIRGAATARINKIDKLAKATKKE